jgi:glycerol-1-phosphate dehydrogenase [NAD(P)+]
MNINTDVTLQTRTNTHGDGVLASLKAECDRTFGKRDYLVISDERIWKAAGTAMSAFMEADPRPGLFLLPASPAPYADDALVARIRGIVEASGALPLAFGSGTINDVVKRAAHELGLPYACVPTAPSVDGFAAFGAAITVRGFKTTLECPAPALILADDAVLAAAPADLVASGYGDLIGKLPAGADWIVAEELGVEAIDPRLWDLVQPTARSLLSRSAAINAREPEAVAGLYEGLIASGLAMQAYRDSRPASGAEHLLSHVWEMRHLGAPDSAPSHGFKVAVGSVVMCDFMRRLFAVDKDRLAASAASARASLAERRRAAAERLIEPGAFKDKTLEVVAQKTLSGTELGARQSRAIANWEGMRRRVLEQLPGQAVLEKALREAGCPSSPADIKVDAASLESCILTAALIRKRYTVLDLAAELGLLDEMAAASARALAGKA